MSPACNALVVSSSLRRGPATSWASLRPLVIAGAVGRAAAAVALVGLAAGAAVVHPARLSTRTLAATRARFTLADRTRPRRSTPAANTSSAAWARVVGQVGYTPRASMEARKLALPSGIT